MLSERRTLYSVRKPLSCQDFRGFLQYAWGSWSPPDSAFRIPFVTRYPSWLQTLLRFPSRRYLRIRTAVRSLARYQPPENKSQDVKTAEAHNSSATSDDKMRMFLFIVLSYFSDFYAFFYALPRLEKAPRLDKENIFRFPR